MHDRRFRRRLSWMPIYAVVSLFALPAIAADLDAVTAGVDDLATMTPAPASHATLWCSVGDADARRAYVSDLIRVANPSPFRLWDYQSRFARAVSGAGGPSRADSGGSCRTAPSLVAASSARDALIRTMESAQWQVVMLGVF